MSPSYRARHATEKLLRLGTFFCRRQCHIKQITNSLPNETALVYHVCSICRAERTLYWGSQDYNVAAEYRTESLDTYNLFVQDYAP